VHRLGAVAVGVEQEGAVVVLAVLRPLAGRAVVAMARGAARLPERVDVRARGCREADVQPARGRVLGVRRGEREVVPLDELVARRGDLDLECAQDGAVERLGRRAVRNADGDVVEQRTTRR